MELFRFARRQAASLTAVLRHHTDLALRARAPPPPDPALDAACHARWGLTATPLPAMAAVVAPPPPPAEPPPPPPSPMPETAPRAPPPPSVAPSARTAPVEGSSASSSDSGDAGGGGSGEGGASGGVGSGDGGTRRQLPPEVDMPLPDYRLNRNGRRGREGGWRQRRGDWPRGTPGGWSSRGDYQDGAARVRRSLLRQSNDSLPPSSFSPHRQDRADRRDGSPMPERMDRSHSRSELSRSPPDLSRHSGGPAPARAGSPPLPPPPHELSGQEERLRVSPPPPASKNAPPALSLRALAPLPPPPRFERDRDRTFRHHEDRTTSHHRRHYHRPSTSPSPRKQARHDSPQRTIDTASSHTSESR